MDIFKTNYDFMFASEGHTSLKKKEFHLVKIVISPMFRQIGI